MRPSEGAKVQKNGLTVLNLDVGHDDGCGVVRDVVRRRKGKGGPKRAALARCGLNRNRQTVRLALRDHDFFTNRFNPEDCRHLEGVGVRFLGRGVVVAREKRDLGSAASEAELWTMPVSRSIT